MVASVMDAVNAIEQTEVVAFDAFIAQERRGGDVSVLRSRSLALLAPLEHSRSVSTLDLRASDSAVGAEGGGSGGGGSGANDDPAGADEYRSGGEGGSFDVSSNTISERVPHAHDFGVDDVQDLADLPGPVYGGGGGTATPLFDASTDLLRVSGRKVSGAPAVFESLDSPGGGAGGDGGDDQGGGTTFAADDSTFLFELSASDPEGEDKGLEAMIAAQASRRTSAAPDGDPGGRVTTAPGRVTGLPDRLRTTASADDPRRLGRTDTVDSGFNWEVSDSGDVEQAFA